MVQAIGLVLIRSSKPVIAAINGAAIGVGLTQVLPMDFIVASTEAKLSCRFIKMGLVPELASSKFLIARCGFGAASELMLTGKTILADEAFRVGLVDKVTAPENLLDEARTIARAMGENPPQALRKVKQLIAENMDESDLGLVQSRELEALSFCYQTPEHKEAIDAFLEKKGNQILRGTSYNWSFKFGRAIGAKLCEEDSIKKPRQIRTCPVSWRS